MLRLPAIITDRFARLSRGTSRRGLARGWQYAPVNRDDTMYAGTESGT